MVPGDDASALFNSHRDRIYRYVLSLVRNPAEAEDLTQDTFLRAHAHRESLRDPSAAGAWLYRIATRACIDHLRQRVVPLPIQDDEGPQLDEVVPSPLPSVLEVAEREETAACVQRCLGFLSDRYRALVLMHEAETLTAPEIARLLGESVGAVKIRLHRARRKLQEIMEIGCVVSEARSGVPCCEAKVPEPPDRRPSAR